MTHAPAALAPTARKLRVVLALAAVAPAAVLLRMIPPPWDLLDLRAVGGLILTALCSPIWLLDALTDSAFAPRGGAFLVLPTLPQLAFALAFDLAVFYLAACAWVRLHPDNGRVA